MEQETKICPKCGIDKLFPDEFYRGYKWGREGWAKPEVSVYLCKECYKDLELNETHIKTQIFRKLDVEYSDIAPLLSELIEQKRNIIKMKRLIKDLKTKQNELSKS